MENYLTTVTVPGDEILNLAIWAPAESATSSAARQSAHPVIVWIHGGALSRGSNAITAFDGTAFARDGIVFVAVNYRLGAEGFSVLDDVDVNLGLADQVAALRWVRRNAAAFGGDPENVTVMGESAGAICIAALLAHPSATELFDRAIMQSGPPDARPRKKTRLITDLMAKQLGVPPTRAAFAATGAQQLLEAQKRVTAGTTPITGGPAFALTLDSDLIPRDPATALGAGRGSGIPLLIGANSEEYRLWFIPSGAIEKITRTQLALARLAARVPRTVIAAHRRRRPDAKPGEILGEVVTDMLLRAPITRFADSRIGTAAPTWVYEFRWQSPVDGLGAAHAMELGFVFDRVDAPDSIALGGADAPQALADAMHGAWVRFIVGGDPGWEQWSPRQPVEVFDADGGHIDYAPRADELAGLPDR
jgi:para-nitrobenzyl esterase